MKSLDPVEVQLARCKNMQDVLQNLVRIHLEIDPPNRKFESNEPDFVFSLRKICLHSIAVNRYEVNADGLHVIALELRAAYEQMHTVWKILPPNYRFEKDAGWWQSEARYGLATYSHPTMFSLTLPLAQGGFDDAEAPDIYLRLAIWIGRLGCGYGLALSYLAGVLGCEEKFAHSLTSALSDISI